MRWIRSWPAVIPPGRAHVVDDLERLVIADYDYTPLGDIDDDVCLIEWDMALSPEDFAEFEIMAIERPHVPSVAPYRLYHVASGPVWAHRVLQADGGSRWVLPYAHTCDYFAFGLIYLPRQLVRAFLAADPLTRGAPLDGPGVDRRFHDQTFSMWYRHRCETGGPVHIEWSVCPVHLHGK